MKLLIASTFFPPTNSIASLRPYSFAKYWAEMGHEVTVLTVEAEGGGETALVKSFEGFKVVAVPLPRFLRRLKESYRGEGKGGKGGEKGLFKGLFKKFFHLLRFRLGIFHSCRMPDIADLWIAPALKRIAREGFFDVVVSTAGPYSVHLLAYRLLSKGLAGSWVADYRDTWSDNYCYRGLFPLNLFEKVLERIVLRKASLITTVSAPLEQKFAAKYRGIATATIPNGFDSGDVEELDKAPAFPSDGKVRIVHTGSIYLGRRDPSPLFRAIAKLAALGCSGIERLEVIFVGLNLANVEKLAQEYAVERFVAVEGFVARERALAMQRDADLLLFLPWNDPHVDGIVTGKIFEYFQAERPIIAVGASAMELSQQMILDASAGFVFHGDEALAGFLENELLQNKRRASTINREVIASYDRRALAKKMMELIER